ncbi:DNA ligase 3-like [Mytilus edulis]|uniref:DNA ligase 3-like n=1 Tax=Mytilus edulis TaxID=6550 RepID=UPI0039F0896F
MADNKYIVGYAKLGTSGCKKCKTKIAKGELRIGKVTTNPFSDEGGDMKQWFHPNCMFETFKRARATTKKIEEGEDMDGFGDLQQEDKDHLNKMIDDSQANSKSPAKTPKRTPKATGQAKLPFSPPKSQPKSSPAKSAASPKAGPSSADSDEEPGTSKKSDSSDNFRNYRKLCADIAAESSYLAKTQKVSKFLKDGPNGDGFKGDAYLWLKLLLPGFVKRVYNVKSKQLVKLFSQIFNTSLEEMVEDLNQGDVAETVRIFFEQSDTLQPQKKSTLSLKEVDEYLEDLSNVTKEDDQLRILKKVTKRCSSNDLKMFVRLIKHDLRINAGAKHILDGLDENAYAAFQASRDLKDVVERVMEGRDGSKPGMSKKLSVRASLMTPVLPMLAEACRSVEYAMKKCPNGMYAEIKYDGERVQLHKKGDKFSYFSRSLKPVQPHKVQHFSEFIPKAFPSGDDLILDAEVLMVDTKTSKPLPFGSLGVHKKAKFQDAQVCLFIFDCLHLNGENIMQKPIKERRRVLHDEMTEIKNRIMFSEMKLIKDPEDLQDMMNDVFRQGLEGLVLKDLKSIYAPGKRHWLKVKKDYLQEGTMADSADLIVLGAYYGTGNKGGIMSIFLLGAYDPHTKKFCTVTKCHSGFDDKTLDELQKELDVVKISKDALKVPNWLNVNKNLIPDFVVKDPKKSPIWEIMGAEFSQSSAHTADGISIRFPRISKVRDDKTWENATDVPRLKILFKKSKETSDMFPPKKGKSPAATPKKKKMGDDDDSGSETEDDGNNNGFETPPTTPTKGKLPIKKEISDDKVTLTPTKATPTKGKLLMKKAISDDEMTETPTKATPTKGKSPMKRQASDVDDEREHKPSSAKKSKVNVLCNYGDYCYQKNPDHLEKFYHPKKSLPDVFNGAKICIPEKIKDYRLLKRFIIGFDGDVVPEYVYEKATHIIVESGKTAPKIKGKGVCVTVDWLLNSIKKKSLEPTKSYIVT